MVGFPNRRTACFSESDFVLFRVEFWKIPGVRVSSELSSGKDREARGKGKFIHCEVRLRGAADSFYLSAIYGANTGVLRHALWSGLSKFKVFVKNKPWVLMGDFNTLLFPHDGLGGSSTHNKDMEDFSVCLADIDVFDVRYIGEACILPHGISDHSPGIISLCGVLKKKSGGFRFDNFLTSHPDFIHTIQQAWGLSVEGSVVDKVLCRLKALKAPLRRLRTSYGNLYKLFAKLKGELDIIQLACERDPLNGDLHEDLAHLLLAYQQASKDEETFFRQRAKVTWLNEGDGNTKYFHNVVKEKRNYNDDVPTAFVDHFRSIMGVADQLVNPVMNVDLFQRRLTLQESLDMMKPITDSEICNALFGIGNNKAPGSDGFSAKFYKASWSVVGLDVTLAIRNFFFKGRITRELNHTLLCLIPKIPNATKAQSAFILGRRIADNILMAHELVAGYHRNGGPPRCAFKIDIKKLMILGDVQSVEVLKRALEFFRTKSGLSPSIEKSEVIFGNVPVDVRNNILNILPYGCGVLPIRYLGVPLSSVRLVNSHFNVLIQKVRARIHNWKSKTLSYGGRRQLILSVLQSLQLFWMAIFTILAGVLHTIEGLFKDFLWAHGESARGKCRIAWDDVCVPVEKGGLGIKRMSTWNRALLAKHAWDLLTVRSSLWVSWVHLHRLRGASFWMIRVKSEWSWTLRKILDLRPHIHRSVMKIVGDGVSTFAWMDKWLPCGSLSSIISYRSFTREGFTIVSTVADLIPLLHNTWPST
ncbi:hypothetical protein OSB04_024025 [Centaurea solstitialis]|uniref:Uncharacterized protein n=1 Tax=Centaurea solstitialis TaxID=347529 RepID=A0AA38SKZ4_9ASTR|nr:hypothetical protein OSB04_024025 [Centaurea solstitialis]